MPKIPLTPQQKQDKKIRDQLILAHNQVLSAWNFGAIKTWEGVYSKLGYGGEYINQHPELSKGTLTFAQLKEFLGKQRDHLELDILKNHEDYNNRKEQHQSTQVSIPIEGEKSLGLSEPIAKKEVDDFHKILDAVEQENFDQQVRQQKEAKKEEPLGAKDNYGLQPSPNESCSLFWFQKKAVAEGWDKLIKRNLSSVLILSGTGTGKTWMAGGLICRLRDADYHVGKTMSHIPFLYVTKASIVTQTQRVLERDFNLGVEDTSVINIEQLRSTSGKYWLKRTTEIVNGEEEEKWLWKRNVQPAVIAWDECQGLKNAGSLQHNIACALNEMGKFQPKQLFISATPFTKVSEAKCWAVSTHKSLEYICGHKSGFPPGAVLTNETWPAYAKAIAGTDAHGNQQDPNDYNEAAVERLMEDLDDYIVRVKGVRPQFEADNHVEMIDFQTKEDYDFYHKAWDKYVAEKARLEALSIGGGVPVGMALLVRFLKFRMAAEYCRRNILVDRMQDIVARGKAAVCALSFKQTIIAMVMEFEKRGIKRDEISIIWGGGQTGLTHKEKQRAKIKSLKPEQLEKMGTTMEEMLDSLDLEDVEDKTLIDLPEHLRLGMQSMEERQREIDKFQSGKTLYCIYTLKAGGVGLSLHHTDEWLPKDKQCRRKESGYVVEEDIPKIPTRPREVIITPTWSPIELVQGVGRAPRLTSLSITKQTLLFFKGTIEGKVADIANKGLRCLSKIVRHREPWSDLAIKGGQDLEEFKNKLPEDSPDEGTGLVGDESEEDDD